MKRIPATFIYILLGLSAAASAAEKRITVRNIAMSDTAVTADIEVKKLLDEELLHSLSKGMTAALEYQIQLWQERSGWADRLVQEKYSRIKISYDPWVKKYTFQTGSGSVEQMGIDSLKSRCSNLSGVEVSAESDFEQGRGYYLAVRVVIQPMSVENVEEIRRWLSGEAKEFDPKSIRLKDRPERKAGNWFVRLFLNATGFGDRVISGKSESFRFDEE